MKIYALMQKSTEYNDEYDMPQEGGTIFKAFRNKPTQEQIDAAAWAATKGKQPPYEGWPSDMAYVEEIEVDENQIINPEVKMSPKPTYAQKQAEVARLRIDAANLARDHFYEEVGKLFEKYPDLEEFSWTQYTPYFNDGDECTFSVNCDYPSITLKGFGKYDENSGEGDSYGEVLYYRNGDSDKVYVVNNNWSDHKVYFSYGRRGGTLVGGVKLDSENYGERSALEEKLIDEKKREGYGSPKDDVKQLLSSMAEEDMKSIFGDHVEVVATRDGITAEPYSHD